MKAKINKSGFLEIKRKGKYKLQFCPFTFSSDFSAENRVCGDWCPLFGEPESILLFDSIEGKTKQVWQLQLCHKTLQFEEIIDERK